jgi:hypothetical protein
MALMASTRTSALPDSPPRGFGRFWRALRQLFHEIMGAIFGILALIWVQNSLRAWAKDVPHWVVVLSLGFAVLMGAFAWGSFRRARQLR